MLFVLFRKPRWSRALTALAGVLAVFLVVYLVIFSSGTNTSVHFGFKTLEASAPRPVAACMDGRQRSGRCGMHGAGSGFACILYAAFSISTVFKRAL